MSHLEDIKQYARSCLSDEIPSGQKHKWACQRFLDDLDRVGTTDFPYIWSEDNANRIAKNLTTKYNKARQSAITTEVSEITAGVESMKG